MGLFPVGEMIDAFNDPRREPGLTNIIQGDIGIFNHIMKDGKYLLVVVIHLKHETRRV